MPIAAIAISICSFLKRCTLQERQYFVCDPKLCFRWPGLTACTRQTPSRPLSRMFFWDLITDWQLSFFTVFKTMPITAFFACIFSSALFFGQDLFVVIRARAYSWLPSLSMFLVQRVPFLLRVESLIRRCHILWTLRVFSSLAGSPSAHSRQGQHREGTLPLVIAIFLAHHRHIQLFQVMCSGP